jgi:hypothetical protein
MDLIDKAKPSVRVGRKAVDLWIFPIESPCGFCLVGDFETELELISDSEKKIGFKDGRVAEEVIRFFHAGFDFIFGLVELSLLASQFLGFD